MSEVAFVHQFQVGPWDNFIYFIGDKGSREVAVVDPAWDAATIFAEAERLDVTISHILCTHSHFDHVDQVEALLQKVDIPVHMLKAEIDWSGFRCENLVAHAPGDVLKVGSGLELTMMHTPGHTPGSVTYETPEGIVTGDTLFVQGCGRCDFVGGDPEVMYRTLAQMVETLPGSTRVFPGHNYGPTLSSTLDEELRENPYLAFPTMAEFVAHRMQGKTPNSALPPKPDWTPGH